MSTMITINVTNNSRGVQNFFFFQQPAQYSGGAQVYSNSLYTAPLLPYDSSGAVPTTSRSWPPAHGPWSARTLNPPR